MRVIGPYGLKDGHWLPKPAYAGSSPARDTKLYYEFVSISEQAYVYAPILEKMIDIMAANDKITFKSAFETAKQITGILEVPQHIENAIMTAAFKVISSGKIPGAPDA